MKLMFNGLLSIDGIKPDQVQLVRHRDTRSTLRHSPYSLWVDRRDDFELYQRIQKRQVFRTAPGSLVVSFVVTPSAETLFVGLYGVDGIGRAAPGTLDPVDGNDVTGLYLYDLRLDPRMVELVGKVVVDWGTGYRSWVQRAHKKNKEILEIRRVFRQEEFPGFLEFETSLSKVAGLPSTWMQILSNAKGIYLLTCPKIKEMYVGSATGEGGFQARWEQHALKGGDAVKFKSKDPSDYRVVILEVAGSDATVHDIHLSEQRWIRKLQSIPMGLNEGPGVKPV